MGNIALSSESPALHAKDLANVACGIFILQHLAILFIYFLLHLWCSATLSFCLSSFLFISGALAHKMQESRNNPATHAFEVRFHNGSPGEVRWGFNQWGTHSASNLFCLLCAASNLNKQAWNLECHRIENVTDSPITMLDPQHPSQSGNVLNR